MSEVKLVGILNVTPDSFSDGGTYVKPLTNGTELVNTTMAISDARRSLADGASILDIGGESTRPGATPLAAEQEWERIGSVVTKLIPEYPGRISVDSYHPETHIRLIAAGLGDYIINDVTGFNNPQMREVAANSGMVCIISHLPAKFGTDIQAAHTSDAPMDSIEELANELLQRQSELVQAGLFKDKIILDPGIGFGKTMELNAKLLEFPAFIRNYDPDAQVMIGYSRKRFLGDSRRELEPNLAAGRKAIASGAKYLRVHDLAAHAEIV